MNEKSDSALKDDGLTQYDERIARLVRLAARGFNRALQLRLQTQNVTFGQWIFLRILWQEDGLSQRELSERAHLTEPTAHTALSRMEELGYIERRNVAGNRRRQHAFLTEKGWELRELLEPLAHEVNNAAIRGLSGAEEKTLRKALAVMIRNLEDDEEKAALSGVRVPPTRSNLGS
ncbi:MarR family transcriptional regulator [Epibacterium sp. MM17-32]|uniref:MarR family winged helix-turn-helix transcriptional regulator n=1 Tax=Epibacterium sp. MM17-32 TaxID=2917734 RepID=UPI001EF5581E|nr:MarR family transcriptional regulator [Epibacterium sp. MM17-32]MCG7630128.1 MarR family transcriptional regulator [Epibacterium sp. MM17-32]|tara:strand:- start:4456 stop:4983 length:528 start_codon:yes stop_codon:yes gene_type:complete